MRHLDMHFIRQHGTVLNYGAKGHFNFGLNVHQYSSDLTLFSDERDASMVV